MTNAQDALGIIWASSGHPVGPCLPLPLHPSPSFLPPSSSFFWAPSPIPLHPETALSVYGFLLYLPPCGLYPPAPALALAAAWAAPRKVPGCWGRLSAPSLLQATPVPSGIPHVTSSQASSSSWLLPFEPGAGR